MTGEDVAARVHAYAWTDRKPGLERTRALLAALGNPEKALKFVHITGSNGKTTTTSLIYKIMRDAGLNAALGGNIGESFAYSVATGDYENDDEMMAYYEPAMANIYRKEQNKTGDGQKMMVWAGACMEDACGSKVQHDFDAGPGSMADMPFLAVKNDGSRFCNEAACEMAVMGNFLRSEADQGWYSQIFDSNYMADTEGWPGVARPPEAMASYMPEVEGEKTGVYESLINTFSADTLEELGQKLGLTDVDAFVKTVERYNELAEKGIDEDMGKPAQFLKAIKQPPFYGIHRHIGLSTIIHGVNVNKDMQVLNAEGAPIEGLFAVGNASGQFFGGVDYPMDIEGLSIGRAITSGYYTGRLVASL